MKRLTLILGAFIALTQICGCESPEVKPPPAPPAEKCDLPFDKAACVAVNSEIYPITAEACTKLSKKPYFCREEPDEVECESTEREGMWCCCDSAAVGCGAPSSPPKNESSTTCNLPAAGAVCLLLEATGYPTLADACIDINTMAVPYYCTEKPFDASCNPHPELDGIFCCCDPTQDMFCEAHLAP